jgi:hypothetical protein
MVYLRCYRRSQCSTGDPAVKLQVADLARKKQSCAHCVTAGFATSKLQLSRAVTPESQRSAPATRQGCFAGSLQVRKPLSRRDTELLSQFGAASHSWRPVGPFTGRNGCSFCFALGRGHCTPAEGEACGATEAGERGRHQGLDVWKHCACTDNMHVKHVARWTNQQAAVRVLPAYCAHDNVACGEYWRHRILAVSV